MQHPARAMPFAELWAGLQAARTAAMVMRRLDANTGRSLWCYTTRCVYESSWDDFTLLARGLVLHEHTLGAARLQLLKCEASVLVDVHHPRRRVG